MYIVHYMKCNKIFSKTKFHEIDLEEGKFSIEKVSIEN